jgi:phosphoribosylformimino-5-aminoimidazole carboxamide ribotide isomerase
MHIIPVIDLLGGSVVRGVGGRRSEYRPVKSTIAADAQPATVAQAFARQFGFATTYVADLDAILSPLDRPSYWTACWRAIGRAGLSLWLDAGLRTAGAASHLRDTTDEIGLDVHFVVGLESLRELSDLAGIATALGRERTIFSLDLKDGRPIKLLNHRGPQEPEHYAYIVAAHGISRLIVLDLADVGEGRGTGTLPLLSKIRREMGDAVELIAGGGVRGMDDLQRMADTGCDAALVASALHDGRLTRPDVEAAATMTSKQPGRDLVPEH